VRPLPRTPPRTSPPLRVSVKVRILQIKRIQTLSFRERGDDLPFDLALSVSAGLFFPNEPPIPSEIVSDSPRYLLAGPPFLQKRGEFPLSLSLGS